MDEIKKDSEFPDKIPAFSPIPKVSLPGSGYPAAIPLVNNWADIYRTSAFNSLDSLPLGNENATSAAAYQEISDEAANLRKSIASLQKDLLKTENKSAEYQRLTDQMAEDIKEYAKKEKLSFLWSRVNLFAQKKLKQDESFINLFEPKEPIPCFTLAIDIRKSTELMLKAKSAQLFADFMTTLCEGINKIIKDNFGIIDKFTGDGVLAFFPSFFSGPDAGFLAVDAAFKCYDFFKSHFKAHRKCFIAVLADTGLGIGIDYGNIQLVKICDMLTVIGQSVVYACRLSIADPYDTLLNQPAFEEISGKYQNIFDISEHSLKTKSDPLETYKISRGMKHDYTFSKPDWAQTVKFTLGEKW